ncbi:MAG: DUF1015 domain-containing protein [Ruminococcaceae bacterium]|nr:DUF1015 domain-containing protein [Oscillospiraceae bacterium]
MAIFKPFRAVRPLAEFASSVAALPYDVMNSKEAAEMVKGNPVSFLHVDKAEIDLPEGTDIYDEKVYLKARENLEKLEKDNICRQDATPCFYIYRQIMNGRSQTGIVGCAAIDDYIEGRIKRHEFTRADKEADRIRHVDYCDANTGPIFLCYRSSSEISEIVKCWKENHSPVYDFVTEDGIGNTVWVVDDEKVTAEISAAFGAKEALYIADGHHRCASAVKVGLKRREENPGYDSSEEFNYFLAVCFPADELEIMDYNRVMKDLGGKTSEEFILALNEKFTVEKVGAEAYRPEARHTFGMYLENEWYKLTAKEGTFPENDPVASLDVSILQENCITPIFGITDPRTDKRIDFIGGIRGLAELEKRCREDMVVAFSMYPTSLNELMAIADAGEVMPPKSTWFEPKLLSGLFIHKLK